MGIVASIQAELNSRYNLNIAVDNIYGNETRGALVKGLQNELCVYADGIFGKITRGACINVQNGAKGKITWLVQAMLICHGFNISLDRIFGNETENAVKEFQRRNNLSIDGICGKNTFEKLCK